MASTTICTRTSGSVQHLPFLTAQEKAVFKTAFELDQRWVIEHAADRAPFICQSQSVNVFLPANVHKRDLHQIHLMAWKRGLKSLYYCRSLSIQRADNVSEKAIRYELFDATHAGIDYRYPLSLAWLCERIADLPRNAPIGVQQVLAGGAGQPFQCLLEVDSGPVTLVAR